MDSHWLKLQEHGKYLIHTYGNAADPSFGVRAQPAQRPGGPRVQKCSGSQKSSSWADLAASDEAVKLLVPVHPPAKIYVRERVDVEILVVLRRWLSQATRGVGVFSTFALTENRNSNTEGRRAVHTCTRIR